METVALDCEFVGVGPKGRIAALGRCSIVDLSGDVLLDVYAMPHDPITDYRTPYSGITRQHMKNSVPLEAALSRIKATIKDRVVVGHSLKNDFSVLKLWHPAKNIRDTSTYKPLQELAGIHHLQQVSLKRLALGLLDRVIQAGRRGHCSVEDARASMDLYKLVARRWEKQLARIRRKSSTATCGYQPVDKVQRTAEGGGYQLESSGGQQCSKHYRRHSASLSEDEGISLYLRDEYWPIEVMA